MRIALITREYPPETSWGGIGTFYFSFANSLKKSGCDVEVFTQGISNHYSEKQNGILVHRVLLRKRLIGKRSGGDLAGNKSLGVFALSLAVEMLRGFSCRHRQLPFDLVEGHEHLGINTLINIRHKGSLATVTRYHTAYHTLVSRGLANWPGSSIIRYLERWSLLSAQYRISTSYFIDKITRKDFPNVPSADAIIPLNISIPNSLSFSSKVHREPLILFVGRMMPGHKNPDMVAKAFVRLADRFPKWCVEFAGLDIPISPEKTMWEKCEEILAPCKGRFKYHKVLSREKLNILYSKARIVVIPSKFESFGLVAQEAMTAGCVPVVADNTALPESVGDAGIVFRNGSIDDLVSKLEHIMSAEQYLELASAACVRRIAEDCSEDSIMKMNLDFFKKAIKNKKSDCHIEK